MTRFALAASFCIFSTTLVQAQHHHTTTASPYAGFEARAVKALSDREIEDLKAGRGMGLALAAELNGYPGPLHVLELREQLGLTEAQRLHMQELYEAMKAEAIPLGERLIGQETELDRQFADGTITPARLAGATAAIGTTQGELRAAHLRHHLSTLDLLTPGQVRLYRELRGYSDRK
jgi:hypothetical protein